MTEQRVSANDTGLQNEPEPVTDWENRSVHGLALVHEDLLKLELDDVNRLRARQAEYLASLPKEPGDAIKSARRIMHHDSENYPEGFEEALHLSYALETMVCSNDVDGPGPQHDAAVYISMRITSALLKTARQLARMSDILGNAGT